MAVRDSSIIKSLAVFIVILCVGIVIAVRYKNNANPSAHAQGTDAQQASYVHVTPTVVSPKIQTSEMRSSNADKKLILRATLQKDGSTTYIYSVADITGANEHEVYRKTLPPGASMEVPFNAWDPTDTYVFLQENSPGIPHFYVLKASGEAFNNGEKYISVNAVWTDKQIPYTIRTATGWASGTLLIVYTSKDDGTKGPPYWFEVPSTAIIQLAR